jgi:exodeoxyribonuclease VII large subunit
MSQEYLTVTALTRYVKRKFDADPYMRRVYLTGEMSNFRERPGHQYFSLKDDGAKIGAVMFKGAYSKLKFKPKDGMKVMVVGTVSVFQASGNYQITIERMEPDGVGALYQAYEELKAKLAAEGLFQLPKKALPRFPRRIAVITSPSGAVIQDIRTTVARRFPIAQIVLFPTVVQGTASAQDIVRNIARVEQGHFDTLIIGRGGGSIEDLWSFNEESVARAIAATTIPVISSVGHETDTTIADLVADVRAATPTAAAELAVPVLTDELLRIKERQNRLEQAFHYQLQMKKKAYQQVMTSYVFTQPGRLYEAKAVQLDQLKDRLQHAMVTCLREQEKQQLALQARLLQATPKNRVAQETLRFEYLTAQLTVQMKQVMKEKNQRFQTAIDSLDLLSPLKIMGRGYSYVTKEHAIVKSVRDLPPHSEITVHLADGFVQATVTESTESTEGAAENE